MPTDLERWDEPGHVHFWTISCYRRLTFFWHDSVKEVVVDGLRQLQNRFRVCVIGYVVMPDHVHVLVYPHARGQDALVAVSRLLHAFKQHIGYHAKEALRAYWRRHGSLWGGPLNDWAHGAFEKKAIWFKRAYDFNITEHATLLEKLDYCHKNPATRGLVDDPADWRWSSYRYYELGDRSVLPMDWDGAWPIVW